MYKKSSVLIIILLVFGVCCGLFFLGYSFSEEIRAGSSEEPSDTSLSDQFPVANDPIYVVGHRNTDLDSVCSAVGLAELLQKGGINAVPAVSSEICPEAVQLLDRCGKERPVFLEDATGKTVVLVDHNGLSQGAAGLDAATIAGVIDHHNMQGLSLPSPVFVLTAPVGATATIVTGLYDRYGIDMEPGTATLLLAAILDDTFNMQSIITTPVDEYAVQMLQKRTGIDTAGLYETICRVKTDYGNMTTEEILRSHEKLYEMSEYLVYISDIPVMGEESMDDMLSVMTAYLNETDPETEMTHRYVIISDLGAYSSELIHDDNGEEILVNRAFTMDSDGRIIFEEVVSRKATIVPPLIEAYAALVSEDFAATI